MTPPNANALLSGQGVGGAEGSDDAGEFSRKAVEVRAPDLSEAHRLLAAGFKLCKLKPMHKQPEGNGWNLNPITRIDNSATGYGAMLSANNLCSIDPDNVGPAREGLRRCGFDLDELMDVGVRTSSTRPGSGGRSTFRAPASLGRVVFRSRTLGTILELRAGQANLQDCLPGTAYMSYKNDKPIGGPYSQRYANGKTLDEAPELPAAFRAWWERMDADLAFKREQQALFCGADDAFLDVSGKGEKLAFASSLRVPFNEYHGVEEIIERHGYTKATNDRWAPSTATGAPSVRLIPGKESLWQSDHGSDPLLGAFDAWSAFVVLDHDGNLDAAEAAAREMPACSLDEFDDEVAKAAEVRREIDAVIGAVGLLDPADVLANVRRLLPSADLAAAECDALIARLTEHTGCTKAEVEKEILPPGAAAKASRFEVIPAAEFATGAPSQWIVREVLPQAELAVIYGESGCGKSFFALDLVAAVARGIEWQGRKVKQGPVVYIAAEGAGGFRKRLAAYASRAGIPLADLPIGVIAAAPNLLTNDDQALAQAIGTFGGASVIVIDTLAQSTPGANENAGEDMGKVIAHCGRLHRATGALIVLIHHAGKDATKGARGWSGIRAAVDAEIEVSRLAENRFARITKQKDGDDAAAFCFRLDVVEVGHDEEGFPVTSCVVEYQAAAPVARKEPQGNVQKLVWRAVLDLIPMGGDAVAICDVIEAVVPQLPHDPTKRDKRREHVTRAIQKLSEFAFFSVQDSAIVLPHASEAPQI